MENLTFRCSVLSNIRSWKIIFFAMVMFSIIVSLITTFIINFQILNFLQACLKVIFFVNFLSLYSPRNVYPNHLAGLVFCYCVGYSSYSLLFRIPFMLFKICLGWLQQLLLRYRQVSVSYNYQRHIQIYFASIQPLRVLKTCTEFLSPNNLWTLSCEYLYI